MRIKQLEELRKIHSEIKYSVETDRENNENMILKAMNKIIELSSIARLEGLLALEDAVMDIPLRSEEQELKQFILLVVDGIEPDVILGIGLTRYYASLYTGYVALRYFIYLEGVLSIQAGENPRILEEKIKAMLPSNLYFNYSIEQEKKQLEKEKKEKENLIEDLCKGKRIWDSSQDGYYLSKLVDYVICDITDKELQRLLREVDNVDLVFAMKGMSGEARKHIFVNLSKRLGQMIAEDMTYIGPVRIIDILTALQKLLQILIELIEAGEISERYEYLVPFYSTFQVDTKVKKEKYSKLRELKEIVEEYEKGADLVEEYN